MRLLTWVLSTHFPFQALLNKIFASFYNISLDEHKPAGRYRTIKDLFTRKLSLPRKIQPGIISPVDGEIIQHGMVKNGLALQIKGKHYKINDLIQEEKNLEKWAYINFYLSPKNYHRYHAPCDLEIRKLRHVPGRLYPVGRFFLKHKKNLYAENERVILECSSKGKRIYLAFIGAFNVGSINFSFEPNQLRTISYKNPILMKKGEELGFFSFGSTVVALFESLKPCIKKGQIRFGETIGSIGK